ncbi:MAG: hypothetical protein PHU71_01985 [Candidatus Gracilibacteria bacterium]|nr:hypothetical protein [Candidatus Gracilibacteria bacterium]
MSIERELESLEKALNGTIPPELRAEVKEILSGINTNCTQEKLRKVAEDLSAYLREKGIKNIDLLNLNLCAGRYLDSIFEGAEAQD